MAEDYENIEEATANLTEEDENILLWAALGGAAAVDIFVTRIESEILRLRQANIGDGEILRIISTDFNGTGRIFGEFTNNLRRGIVSGVMQEDCEARIGQVETWEQWEALGFPATGFSLCKESCYCQLVPEEVEIDDRVVI